MGSPWEAALGDRVESLHPRLRAYFGEIPAGSIGRGEGVFDVVGTPRRWLWPVLAILGLDGVVFAVWERDVPFTVVNRPDRSTVRSVRTFRFARNTRAMSDQIGRTSRGLTDRLGTRGLVSVVLRAEVHDGALVLTCTRVTLASIPLPRWAAPRLTLTERWDAAADCQRVSLVLDAPAIGRIYEYAGSFTYEIEKT